MTSSRALSTDLSFSSDEHDGVGGRLRRERQRRKIGLRELARRLGVSPSLISQIETGKSKPSVATLYAIVTELDVSLDDLLGDGSRFPSAKRAADDRPIRASSPAEPAPTEPLGLVQAAGARKVINLESGVRWERLTATSDPDVDFLYVVYEPGGASSPAQTLMRHSGKEYGFVISGRLEVSIGFDEYELGPGDSIAYDSTIPHRLRTLGDEPVHAIWFVVGRRAALEGEAVTTPRSALDLRHSERENACGGDPGESGRP